MVRVYIIEINPDRLFHSSIAMSITTDSSQDSFLNIKYGREVENYYSGSPLNRLSFLRPNHEFLSAAFTHDTAKFLCLQDLAPLASDTFQLCFVTRADLESLIKKNPFAKTEEQMLSDFDSSDISPLVLFLGVEEKAKAGFVYQQYAGAPYFAIDITPKDGYREDALQLAKVFESNGFQFLRTRSSMELGVEEGRLLLVISMIDHSHTA